MPNVSSKSDASQIIQGVLDESTQSIRTLMSGQVAINVSAAEGDSVVAFGPSSQQSAVVPFGILTGIVVVPPFSVAGQSKLQLFADTTAVLTATNPLLIIEISPFDTGGTWFPLSETLVPSTPAGVVRGAIASILARRARVIMTHGGFTVGSFICFVVGG